MVQSKSIDDYQLAEFKALREEIVMRLEAEQGVLRYSLVLAGIVPAIGAGFESLVKLAGTSGVLTALSLGPILAILLEGMYLKHHVYINVIANYIQDRLLFSGWEAYLTGTLQVGLVPSIFSAFLGQAEKMIPIFVGVLYLVALGFGVVNSWGSLGFLRQIFFALLVFLEACLLAAAWVFVMLVRSWLVKRRRELLEATMP